MDDNRHVGIELKAAIGELRQLATQLADASREWWQNRRQDMNQYNRQYGRQNENRHSDDERGARGYGEGYATAGVQQRPRTRDWEEGRFGEDEYERWGRGRETDDDVRGQYGGGRGGRTGERDWRGAGGGRSGFSDYGTAGQREYGRGFDDSDFGGGYRQGDRESGYYANRGEYSQGYGRERDPGRIYGPEDFSQRYAQGDVFAGGGYGREGRYAREPGMGGGAYGRSGGMGSSMAGDMGSGMGSGSSSWRDDLRGSGGYAESSGTTGTRGFRGRGPRGYTRSDERITEDLNERFTDDPYLDADDLQVSVSGGVATLTGTVEHRWMKHRAEDIADACSGVKDVRNEIRVSPQLGRMSGTGVETSTTGESASRRGGGSTGIGTSANTGTSTSSRLGDNTNPPAGGSTH